MVTVEEASAIILKNLSKVETVSVGIADAIGRVLAEKITVDRDMPPFDRVSMDGIAIAFEEWSRGRRSFYVEATQAAGEKQKELSDAVNCIEVMTGAVLPRGCDTVIRYEDIEIADGNARVLINDLQQGKSVHLQGLDARKGDVILEPGQKLAASEIALLASVGKVAVNVFSFPAIAIISTGDELVDIADTPEAWEIRRSNSYALQAALRELAVEAHCFHLQDKVSAMKEGVEKILQDHDVLILSGGVSKGKFDFVPGVLDELGVRKQFHHVSQRPGKPFWFGTGRSKVAFALPGNPVSTFMCFYRYIKPWILASMGIPVESYRAALTSDVSFQPPLTCFLQVSVTNEDGMLVASPVPGGGSGDFANLKNVNGFLELPLEKSEFKAGEVFPFIPFRH